MTPLSDLDREIAETLDRILVAGQALLSFSGGGWSVVFSPDGKRLASTIGVRPRDSSEVKVKVWDAQSGHELLTFEGPSKMVPSVAFSPDGKYLASADKVWDSQTGQELLTLARFDHECSADDDHGLPLRVGLPNLLFLSAS